MGRAGEADTPIDRVAYHDRLDLIGGEAAGSPQFVGDRLQRLVAQAEAQCFERKHAVGRDVPKPDVDAEPLYQRGLLVLERRFPDQAVDPVAEEACEGLDVVGGHVALVVVDTDAGAGLAPFDDNPAGTPFEVAQRLLRELGYRRLRPRVLLADLGDRDESGAQGVVDRKLAAERGQLDSAVGDLDCAEADLGSTRRVRAAMMLQDRGLEQRAAGAG